MVRHVVHWTLLKNLHDHRVVGVGALSVLILLAGTVSAVIDHRGRTRRFGELAIEAERTMSLDAVKLVRPPQRLGFLSDGGEARLPHLLICVPGLLDYPTENVSDQPFLRPVQLLDWSFVTGYLLSLLALLTSHDFVSGAKDNGTLRLLCSMPVRRGHLILGGLLGSVLSVLPFGVLGTMCSLLIVMVDGNIPLAAEDWLKLGCCLVLLVCYLACFSALGLLISCLFRRREPCMVAAVLVWVVLALVVPGAARQVAPLVSPAPSLYEFEAQLRKAAMKFRSDVVVDSGPLTAIVERPDLTDDQKRRAVAELQETLVRQHEGSLDEYRRDLERLRERYIGALQAQARTARLASMASPTALYEATVEGLVGSGWAADKRFRRQAEGYCGAFTRVATDLRRMLRPQAAVSGPAMDDRGYSVKSVSWVSYRKVPVDGALLPRFDSQRALDSLDSAAFGGGAAVLLAHTMACLGLAHAVFLRYDVR